MYHFNGHTPGKPGSVGCPFDFYSQVILIQSNRTRQAETLYSYKVIKFYPTHLR